MTFAQKCPSCNTVFQQSKEVSELHVFLAAPVCNKVSSKCPACSEESWAYITTEDVVAYMANLNLVPIIQNAASAEMVKHAVDARERHHEQKTKEAAEPTLETYSLTPRLENTIKDFGDEIANFAGFPVDDISIITEAKRSNLPYKWTD